MAYSCLVPSMQNAHNVMISRSTDATVRMTAKLTDMGMCATIKHSSSHHGAKTVRVLSHVAPEVQRHGVARAGPASDIYSFGVMMWEVFTGQQAYRKLLDAEHLYEVSQRQRLGLRLSVQLGWLCCMGVPLAPLANKEVSTAGHALLLLSVYGPSERLPTAGHQQGRI